MNSFGTALRLTTFGESHGPAIGGILDGVEPGISIDLDRVQAQLDRRRPGQSAITTSRSEADRLEVLSGIFEGRTTGTPIAFEIRNANQRSADYGNLRSTFRPSHADWTYEYKYGVRDYRGGGRSSARETAARVAAGAIAAQALERIGCTVAAYTQAIGPVSLTTPYHLLDLSLTDTNAVRCPDPATAALMEALILEARAKGDTLGGVVQCVVRGCPAGLGQPVFGKLQAMLAYAMLSINAAKGFEYGMGFDGATRLGSEMIDAYPEEEQPLRRIRPLANNSGGIQGGISTGEDITMRVAFKPVATLMQPVSALTRSGAAATLQVHGRHDPCVVPRAIPIVESMAALTLYDAWLQRGYGG